MSNKFTPSLDNCRKYVSGSIMNFNLSSKNYFIAFFSQNILLHIYFKYLKGSFQLYTVLESLFYHLNKKPMDHQPI